MIEQMKANPMLGAYLRGLWTKGTLQLAMARSLQGNTVSPLGYKFKPETKTLNDRPKPFVWDLFYNIINGVEIIKAL